MTSLVESEYQRLALLELRYLTEALDAYPDDLDADLAGDVLDVELSDGSRVIINTQRPARQIWMAADRTAWHFDYDTEQRQWRDPKSGAELWEALNSTISAKLDRAVRLSRGGE